ncbi:MAG TPA: DUF4062 domain-containing protein [Vicinamibacterales bacterium]|nr:DUF4062 domain-containing protein [Vicinamibacterales bacterium]
MHFDGDAFISYAHLDDQELIEGHKGWIANLHRALEIRVGQILGKQPQVWRDPKLTGNDFFADTLVERLQRVAVLISVLTPRYVRSEWTRREVLEFWKAAERQGGIRVRDRARVFKVLKTPVPLEMTPVELRALLGYEFFRVDPDTGKVRELNEVFGPDAQREFWMKLDDLAHDIGEVLLALEDTGGETESPNRGTVFVADTTSDLREEYQAIRRELVQHGYTVLPSQALAHVAADVQSVVRADLAECRMSIHLVGRTYGLVPEGGTSSIIELQNELAIARAAAGAFSRLVWMPDGLQVEDARQAAVIERLRMDPRAYPGDLLETPFEDLRTAVHDWLSRDPSASAAAAPAAAAPAATVVPRLYLIHDQRDADLVGPWAEFLFDSGLEVIRPLFEGDEAEIREEHEEALRVADGVLIVFGSAGEPWLRRKLRELQKSAGYGRTKPAPVTAIALVPPKTPEKFRFRTHDAMMIPQWDGFVAEPLAPFLDRVKG